MCRKCGGPLVRGNRKYRPYWCNNCWNEYQRECRNKNIEDRRAYARQYQADHHEKYLESQRRYRERYGNPGRKRKQTEPVDRLYIWTRDGGRCCIGLKCNFTYVPFGEMHLDHAIPVSKGGTDSSTNLQTACKPCNQAKHARILFTVNLRMSNGSRVVL